MVNGGKKRAPKTDASVVALDHARRRHRAGPREAVGARLEGLAAAVTMIWQQPPSIAELVRLVAREHLLWLPEAIRVSEQGVDQRRRCRPPTLFERQS